MKDLGRQHSPMDKEGKLLYMKTYPSRPKGWKYHWFRLRGNLLFYFKVNELGSPESEPKRIMVLERCKIQHEPFAEKPSTFSIAFQNDSTEKKHLFSSPSKAQSEEWVALLRKASYEQLRATLTILHAQILKLTGSDPMEAFTHNLLSVMKLSGRGLALESPLMRDAETTENEGRKSHRDSRRKGVSAREAEVMISTDYPVLIDVPYLDMPISPLRKRRPLDQ